MLVLLQAFDFLKEPFKKRTADTAGLDQPPTTPSPRKKPYNPRKRFLMTSNTPTDEATGTDDIDTANRRNVAIFIAPPSWAPSDKYVWRRPSILGKPTTNLTVICDTLEDFISHQAHSIKEIERVLGNYRDYGFLYWGLNPQSLVAMVKAHKVIKAEAEAMLECLPEELGAFPYWHLAIRRPVGSGIMQQGSINKRILRPTFGHIYAEQIDNADASTNTSPITANKAAKDQNNGFSVNRQQEEEETQRSSTLLELFRGLLRKAHHSRRVSNSSASDDDEFPFFLPGAAADNPHRLSRDLSLDEQHQGHQEDAAWTTLSDNDSIDGALMALKPINVDAGEAYVSLCAALQESLSPPEP